MSTRTTNRLGAALWATAALVLTIGLLFATSSSATANGGKSKCDKGHYAMKGGKCKPPKPNPPPPPPAPPAPPPPADCDHSVMGGKDGKPGNDDCVPDEVTPPPPPAAAPPPPPPPAVQPPPPPPAPRLECPAGMDEIGRSDGQVLCSKTVVVTKTKIKKVKQRPQRIIKRFCPKKPKDSGLTG